MEFFFQRMSLSSMACQAVTPPVLVVVPELGEMKILNKDDMSTGAPWTTSLLTQAEFVSSASSNQSLVSNVVIKSEAGPLVLGTTPPVVYKRLFPITLESAS